MLESLSIIGANATVVAVAGFMVKKWMSNIEESLKQMDKKLDNKIDQELCHERQSTCKEVVALKIETSIQKAIEQCLKVKAI